MNRTLRLFLTTVCVVAWSAAMVIQPVPGSRWPVPALSTPRVEASASGARYKIDASRSRFIVRAFAGGFLSALAHDHTISISEFDGETDFTYGTVEPASLEITIKAGSLAVTDKISDKDRLKIESTMRDEVLEVSKYPEIRFKSNSVSATKTGDAQYQARITGEITLHGVSRQLTIPAQLEFGDKVLHAKGTFALKQSSFGIKPVSVAGGTIKVKDELRFTFDIVSNP